MYNLNHLKGRVVNWLHLVIHGLTYTPGVFSTYVMFLLYVYTFTIRSCHVVLKVYLLTYLLTFLISDIRALWRSDLNARVPEYQKLKTYRIQVIPGWH